MALHLSSERAPSPLDRYLPEPPELGPLPMEYLLAVLRLALGWHFLALAFTGRGTLESTALLAVGASLLLGVLMRVAAAGGVALVAVHGLHAWPAAIASLDPLILAVLLVLLAASAAGDTCGLGRIWADTPAVRRFPWLA